MWIVFILICASIAVAADFKNKYSLSLMGKLINETPVDYRNYKFIASFRRKNVHFCTASLLSNKHALTTATCLKDFLSEEKIPDFDYYTIKAGRFDLPGKSAVFSIYEVQCHPKFSYINPLAIYNIGMITLRDNNATESKYVGWGLLIPPGIYEVEGGIVTVWANIHGTEKGNRKDNYTLIANTVKAKKRDYCGFNRRSPIICAQSVTGNQFFSEKDIGAPLIEGNFIRGILIILPSEPSKPFTFLNIQKYLEVLDKLRIKSIKHFRIVLPRKKARIDPIFTESSENRRVRHKPNSPETNAEVSD